MKRITKQIWLLVVVLVLMAHIAVAEGSVGSVKLNQVQQRGADLTMYVNLSDSSGNPVEGGFTADYFDAQIGDSLLTVDNVQPFDPQTMGIHYVLCIDVSASLTDAMMQNVHDGLSSFVDGLGPADTVSILTFGTTVETKLQASGDHALIKETINATRADDDNTALYKGVLDGANIAAKVNGRSTVIVITDGKNDVEKAGAEMQQYTKESIYSNVQTAQVPLYCIGLTDKNGVDSQSLQDLAAATGGEQYEVPAAMISGCLNRVQNIMRSTLVLHAQLANTEGKSGINSVEAFTVSFTSDNGLSTVSNSLQQAINWSRVPAPEFTPGPTVVPAISLSLDETSLQYSEGGDATITGMIGVDEGSIAADELSIYVNGERWEASLMRNGNGYVFSAKGVVSSSVSTLEVQARGASIASGIQRMSVIGPTAEPSATPGPSLNVTLDETSNQRMFVPGESLEVSGVIDVQGQINPNDLTLYINDQQCEMTVEQLNANQYGFSTDYTMQADTSAELNIQVRLNGAEIASPRQRLPLVTPSPTPAPELTLSLDNSDIVYVDGDVATLSGTIYVNGAVNPDDLALYVEGVRWSSFAPELRDDGSYHFEAQNTLTGEVGSLEMRVKLLSDSSVGSNTVQIAAYTPEPITTPTPTPRPPVTPPPTTKTSVEPAPTEQGETTEDVSSSGIDTRMWYVIAGIGLLLVLIIVFIIVKSRKPRIERTDEENGFRRNHTGGNQAKTVREGDAPAPKTVRDDKNEVGGRTEQERTNGARRGAGKTSRLDGESGGTRRMDVESGGTRRLEAESGGTRRLDDNVRTIEILIEEKHDSESRPDRTIHMKEGDKLVFGRRDARAANVLIDDDAISVKHLSITFDGTDIYVSDLHSTNGTILNDEKLIAGTQSKVKSGDRILLGVTTLRFSFKNTAW